MGLEPTPTIKAERIHEQVQQSRLKKIGTIANDWSLVDIKEKKATQHKALLP